MSTETIEKKSVVRKPIPLYKVLLHNDDATPMQYVIDVLMKTIPNMQPPKARAIMMEAHNNGMALVIVCTQEHAEFYSECLNRSGLISTFEPDC